MLKKTTILRRSLALCAMATLLVLCLAGCASGNGSASTTGQQAATSTQTETVTDSAGNTFDLPMKLDNVIVLNSDAYDMICALGKDDIVTGVTDTTLYPDSASSKAKYGDWRKPDVEKIIEAHPDAVIGYASYLDEGVVQQIKDAGITVIEFDFYVPSKIPDEMLELGKMLGAEDRASQFNSDIKSIQDMITDRTNGVPEASIYYESYSDYSSVGAGSGGAELLEYAHVKSLTADETTAYPKVSDEWVVTQNPQAMVKVVSDPKKILGESVTDTSAAQSLYQSIASRPGWSSIDAIANKHFCMLSSRIGTSATGAAIAPLTIAKTAYPDKFQDVDPNEYLNTLLQKYWNTDLQGIWIYTD